MFWEFYQNHRISRAESRANSARSEAERSHAYINLLEDKVDSLALACQSLWELLRDQTALTEADLQAKMEEIDLRDGCADGKMTTRADACAQCGRKTSRRRPRCLYCGHEITGNEAFGQR